MFPYDAALAETVRTQPQSIADVLLMLETIDIVCVDTDGLKWFNWLYWEVTKVVQSRENAGGFANADWLAKLDVQFARLYFGALGDWLAGSPCPDCWRVLFENRNRPRLGRIQFALAGINAHINRDLADAIVRTGTAPVHGSSQYNDYTALNATLDTLIESAKKTLHVRLPGDFLPPVPQLEDTIASWSLAAAREAAWVNAELLWQLRNAQPLAARFLDSLDGLTAVVGKALLVEVP